MIVEIFNTPSGCDHECDCGCAPDHVMFLEDGEV